jgi:peptidylprolyl isomerase
MSIANGDTVSLHYTGKIDSGDVFDSSREREPLEVTVGQGQLIPGFEDALMGMSEGETKSFRIEPENAYGAHRPELVQDVARSMIPEEIDLKPGVRLNTRNEHGQEMTLTVIEADSEKVKLDANHPLAGKALNFDIEVMKVA